VSRTFYQNSFIRISGVHLSTADADFQAPQPTAFVDAEQQDNRLTTSCQELICRPHRFFLVGFQSANALLGETARMIDARMSTVNGF